MSLLIIDGNNNFIRSFVVVPTMNMNGDHVGGVTGFLKTLKVLIRDLKPNKTIVVWDGDGGSLKRRTLYKEYKAGRKPRLNRQYDLGSPEDNKKNMVWQYEKAMHYCSYLGVNQIRIDNIEADDVIAFLSKHIYDQEKKVIVSTDKDFLQLVDDNTIIYSPIKKKYYTKANMEILPENHAIVKAVLGDNSDNIQGIKGIGEKTILKMFPELSERLITLNEMLDKIKNNENQGKNWKNLSECNTKLKSNYELMQLSVPIISANSANKIRNNCDESNLKFNMFDFKLNLMKDGITITDRDFFDVFKQYWLRHQFGDKK